MDLIVTHLDQQMARFYRNLGRGIFEDATFGAKLSYTTFHASGFGAAFWITITTAGATYSWRPAMSWITSIAIGREWLCRAEADIPQRREGIFANVSDQLGPDLQTPCGKPGAAVGDYDNDGDLDILVSNNGGAPQLLRNDGGNANHWFRFC